MRNVARARIADPDAAAAYRALEDVISIGCDTRTPPDVRPLARAVLRAYARALSESQTTLRPIAWATFIRSATLLYFAFDRYDHRYADPDWRRAAQTLRQIALENADLIDSPPEVEAS